MSKRKAQTEKAKETDTKKTEKQKPVCHVRPANFNIAWKDYTKPVASLTSSFEKIVISQHEHKDDEKETAKQKAKEKEEEQREEQQKQHMERNNAIVDAMPPFPPVPPLPPLPLLPPELVDEELNLIRMRPHMWQCPHQCGAEWNIDPADMACKIFRCGNIQEANGQQRMADPHMPQLLWEEYKRKGMIRQGCGRPFEFKDGHMIKCDWK